MAGYQGRYREIRALNRGSYGEVMLVENITTGVKYAAKRIPLINDDLKEAADTEIKVLTRLNRHPRIIGLLEHFRDSDSGELVLILEYCAGGDLHEAIQSGLNRGQTFAAPRERLRTLALQLLDALEYCHSKGVYHRDIKPENILLTKDLSVKLADWGLASLDRDCTEFGVGSEQYMAPECFDPQTKSYDGAKADIWAIGIVLLNVLFGRNPFKTAHQGDRLFTDFASCRETLYDIFPALSNDVFAVLRHSLTIDPANRSLPAMRAALLEVKTWTTDDELEILSQSWEEERGVAITSSRAPFRVPSAISRSLSPVRGGWDRRKMFTPPASRAPFFNAISHHSASASHSYNHHGRRRSRRHSSMHRQASVLAIEESELESQYSRTGSALNPPVATRHPAEDAVIFEDDEQEEVGVFSMEDLDAALAESRFRKSQSAKSTASATSATSSNSTESSNSNRIGSSNSVQSLQSSVDSANTNSPSISELPSTPAELEDVFSSLTGGKFKSDLNGHAGSQVQSVKTQIYQS